MRKFIRRFTSLSLALVLLATSIDVSAYSDDDVLIEEFSTVSVNSVSEDAVEQLDLVEIKTESLENTKSSIDANSGNNGKFRALFLQDGLAFLKNASVYVTPYKCENEKYYYYGDSEAYDPYDNSLASTVALHQLNSETTACLATFGNDYLIFPNYDRDVLYIYHEDDDVQTKSYVCSNEYYNGINDKLCGHIFGNSYGYAVAGSAWNSDPSGNHIGTSSVYYNYNGVDYTTNIPWTWPVVNLNMPDLPYVIPVLTEDYVYIFCLPYTAQNTNSGLTIYRANIGETDYNNFTKIDTSKLSSIGLTKTQITQLCFNDKTIIEGIKGTNDIVINTYDNSVSLYYNANSNTFQRLDFNGDYKKAYIATNKDSSVVTLTYYYDYMAYTIKLSKDSMGEVNIPLSIYNSDTIVCFLNSYSNDYVYMCNNSGMLCRPDKNIFMSYADNLWTDYPYYSGNAGIAINSPLATVYTKIYTSPYVVGSIEDYRLGADGTGTCADGYIDNGLASTYEYVGQLAHDIVTVVVKESPDCVTKGTHKEVCSRGDYTSEELEDEKPYGDHSPINVTTILEPTCTEKGMRNTACEYCDKEIAVFGEHAIVNYDEYILEDYQIPALGHNYTEYETVKKPTCTRSGLKVRTCSRCGEDRLILEPLGHDFVVKEVVKDSTCSELGTCTMGCTRCGLILSNCDYDCKEHEFEDSVPVDSNPWYSSYVSDTGMLSTYTRTCKHCGYSYEVTEHYMPEDYVDSYMTKWQDLAVADDKGYVSLDTIQNQSEDYYGALYLDNDSNFTISTQEIGVLDETLHENVRINGKSLKEFLNTESSATILKPNYFGSGKSDYGWYWDAGRNYWSYYSTRYNSLQSLVAKYDGTEPESYINDSVEEKDMAYCVIRVRDSVDSVIDMPGSRLDEYGTRYSCADSLKQDVCFYKLEIDESLSFTTDGYASTSADIKSDRDNYYLVVATPKNDGRPVGVFGINLSSLEDTSKYVDIANSDIDVTETYTYAGYTLEKAAKIKVSDEDTNWVRYRGISHSYTQSDSYNVNINPGYTLVQVPVSTIKKSKSLSYAYNDKQFEYDYSRVLIPASDFTATMPYYEWFIDGATEPIENGDVIEGIKYTIVGSELQASTTKNINSDETHSVRCLASDYKYPDLGKTEFTGTLIIENIDAKLNVDATAVTGEDQTTIEDSKVTTEAGNYVQFTPSSYYYKHSSNDTWDVDDTKPTWTFTNSKGKKYTIEHDENYLTSATSLFSGLADWLGRAGASNDDTLKGYIADDGTLTIKLTKSGTLTSTLDARYGYDTVSYDLNVLNEEAELIDLKAVYTGDDISINNNYDKSDVTVTAYYDDDSEVVLGEDDWTESSLLVSKVGDNSYTATYKGIEASYTVVGTDYIISISAEYMGDPVYVGNVYNKEDVLVRAQYASGVSKNLEPSEWSASSIEVTEVGDNQYYAIVGNFRTAYTVIGYKEKGITANYSGPNIKVGSNYSKTDVSVILEYTEDTIPNKTLSTDDWTESGLTVTVSGNNIFTATYKELTSDYTVVGIDVPKDTPEDTPDTPEDTPEDIPKVKIISITATYVGDDILVGKDYNKSDVVVVAHWSNNSASVLTDDEWTESSLTVSKLGENTFTAAYLDFTADYVVTGIKKIKGIKAKYTGDDIEVGKKYSKSDVTVYVIYTDGSKKKLSDKDWDASSLKVSKVGKNKYTATYKTYTSSYTINGFIKNTPASVDIPAPTVSSPDIPAPSVVHTGTRDYRVFGLCLMLVSLALGLYLFFTRDKNK